MKLQFKGAYRNHGVNTLHSSEVLELAPKNRMMSSDKKKVVVSQSGGGVALRFNGSANMSTNSDYEFCLTISDQELLELFEYKFGLETTVLEVKKEIFGELVRQSSASGRPSPRIPLLAAPKGS